MVKGNPNIANIDRIRTRIVDSALSISIVFIVAGMIVSGIRYENPFQHSSFIIQLTITAGLILTTIFKNRIKLLFKVLAVIVSFSILMIFGLLDWGFMASAKAYIVFLPIFASFVVPYKRSLILLFFLLAIYVIFSILYINGVLEYPGDANEYIKNISSWGVDLFVLGVTSFACLYIGLYYSKSIISNLTSLQKTDSISKKRKEKLIESEERYKTLVDAFPDMIMISDGNNRVVYGNDNLAKMTGLYPEDYDNPERKTRIHPDDLEMVMNLIADLMKSEETITPIFENRILDRWGNVRWHSGTISKVYINNALHLQSVARDITEKKNIEFELEEHRKNLEKLVKERTSDLENLNEELRSNNEELTSKSKIIADQNTELMTMMENLKVTQSKLIEAEKMASLGVLTSGVSHELNNPLNFIKGGYTGLEKFLEQTKQLDEQNISILLNSIKTGIERASEIVAGLNQFGRQSSDLDEECNMHRIINNAISLLGQEIRGRITINMNLKAKNYIMSGNRGALQRTIYNILMNAVQSIENNGEIHISTLQEKNFIETVIKDSGCGIPEENMSRITEPFFTTREVGKGTGLGLSVAYSTIQEHSGTLKIESKPEKGTIVSIKLPTVR